MAVYEQGQLEKLQKIELEMLQAVDGFCREHGICYLLIGGTVIGAARHQGFIPWDDDIDIAMMKEDYDRFCRLFSKNPPVGYSMHTHQNTENFPYMFGKVYREGTRFMAQECIDSGLESCVYLDVYPFEFASPALSEAQIQRLIDKSMLWQRFLYMRTTAHPAVPPTDSMRKLKLAVSFVGHYLVKAFVPERWLQEKYERTVAELAKGGSREASRYIACPEDEAFFEVDELLPPSYLLFEGREFPVPHRAEAFLAKVYGDWRQLPPEDKRKTHAPVILDFGDL